MAVMSAEGAGLFMLAIGSAFEVFSAMNSSPWTAESFGADERRAKACREYVAWGALFSLAIGAGASVLAGSPYPLLGSAVMVAFLVWIYKRALARGKAAMSTGWANG